MSTTSEPKRSLTAQQLTITFRNLTPQLWAALNKGHQPFLLCLTFSTLTISVTLLRMLSNSFMLFLHCGTQNCTQCSKWGHTSAEQNRAGPDAPQGTVGPFGCQGTLLTPVQIAINQNTQIPFQGAALQSLLHKFVRIARVALTQGGVQNPALLLEFNMTCYCPAL